MAGRRMGSGSFEGSYTRRPASNVSQSSLLGQPPNQQFQSNYNNSSSNNNQGGGNYGGGYGQQNQSRQQNNSFDDSYIRRDKGGDYFSDRSGYGGGNQGGRDSFNDRRDNNYGSGGNNNSQFMPSRVPRERDFRNANSGDGWRQRSRSPNSGPGRGNDNWGRNNFDDRQRMSGGGNVGMNNILQQNSNIGQGSGQRQQQPVVVVVPQGNSGAGGLVNMVPVQGSQNPFNVQRQQPMQVMVANLPAFNTEFGQQILAAANARPLGQGGMMGGPQMGGLMNNQRQEPERQQQLNRYDRSIAEGSSRSLNSGAAGRFTRPSNHRSSANNRSAVVRRSDNSSGSVNKIARNSSSSATLRGNRKRAILRDRHGTAADEIERKRARKNVQNQVNQKQPKNKAKNKKKPLVPSKDGEKKDATDSVVKTEDDSEEKKEDDEAMDVTVKEEPVSTEPKKSKYDEFPENFLVCKICEKVLASGHEYDVHFSSKGHTSLVKLLENRFTKRAELLKYESKMKEEELGLDKPRRTGKTGKGSKNFCTMCDSNYAINWGAHKGSLNHRILREYLHPSCGICNNNFVHRMDWVNHLVSVAHLKKLVEKKEEGEDVQEYLTPSQDYLFTIQLDVGRKERVTSVLHIRPVDYKLPNREDIKDMLSKDENGELVLPEGDIDIPTEYKENQRYGEDALLKVEGACCKVCKIFVTDDPDTHLGSKQHFDSYVTFLKHVVAYRKKLKAAEEAAQKAKEKAEAEEREKALKAEQEEKERKEKEKQAEAAKADVKTEEQVSVKAPGESSEEQKDEATPMETETLNESSAGLNDTTEKEAVKSEEIVNANQASTPSTPVKVEETQQETPKKAESPEKKIEPPADAEPKVESPTKAADPTPSETVKAEPLTPAAKTPTSNAPKTPAPARGGAQQGRGRGGARVARGAATPRGGRGRGGQTPQPGRGGGGNQGGGMRGRGSPGGRGGGSPNWRARGGRVNRGNFQR